LLELAADALATSALAAKAASGWRHWPGATCAIDGLRFTRALVFDHVKRYFIAHLRLATLAFVAVDKDVPLIARDETIALDVVEKLHYPCARHF